jgi:hypothetical protein
MKYTARTAMPAFTIAGPWDIRFPAGWGAPEKVTVDELISWTEHADAGVRHFSGSSTYIKEANVPAGMVRPGRMWYLNLGTVKEVAELSINGKALGVLWKPPFLLEVSDVIRAGANHLEIRVTNLWPNRLIGDQKLPQNQRYTWTNSNPYSADSPLLPSGLLGPVTLYAVERVKLQVNS